jgi:hypothetical protein
MTAHRCGVAMSHVLIKRKTAVRAEADVTATNLSTSALSHG